MELYLIRHAEAEPAGRTAGGDAGRPLSARGYEEAAAIGTAISRLDDPPALVLTSPLLRAVQTAQAVCQQLAHPPELRESAALAPGLRVTELFEELAALSAPGPLALVAHQPDMGNLISWLIADGTEASLKMVPCSLARLTLDIRTRRPRAVLHWFVSPDLIRRLVAP